VETLDPITLLGLLSAVSQEPKSLVTSEKNLGDPSEKLSGDIPRARITNIIWNEVLGPLALVVITLVPYLFINAQTGVAKASGTKATATATVPTNALIRIGIVALAPVGINLGICAFFFALACCAGPLLTMCCKKFGAVLAGIAHGIATVMLIVFFEVLWFLEGFNFARALAGMIAVTAIQRFIYKLLIVFALTREFKTDASNIAFWTGKWYGLGLHAFSQPARELLCKTTEMGFFATDCILGHFLLFLQFPIIIIPYVDRLHSVILFWLRPSKQIRPPIYSSKVSKLRKRRVIRFAVLYFVLLALFVGLIVGPIVGHKYIPASLVTDIPMELYQPTNFNNTDISGWSTDQFPIATTSIAVAKKVKLI